MKLRLSVLVRAVICALVALAGKAQLAPLDPVKRGEALARQLCVSCHLFPAPELLDKKSWEFGALPMMANRLGVKALKPDSAENRIILEDWSQITAYYLSAAPAEALPQPPRAPVTRNLTRFIAEPAPYRPSAFNISMVKIDGSRIYVGNAEKMSLDELDSSGRLVSSFNTSNPVVAMDIRKEGAFVSMIGTLSPSETPLGKVSWFERGANWIPQWDVADKLHRPTALAFADLNGDGREDVIVTTFGHITGHFSWFENLGNHQYAERLLIDRPGAVRAHLVDFNKDGRPDIVVMMAQGKEGIFLLGNVGNGKFVELNLLEHHPAWGSASFELADIDHDGDLDIITANGDNGEFNSCLKNYHGVRIYLNDGKVGFAEKYFFPLYGAFKAVPADFDGDGDLDIAAIAYFADFEGSPHEAFVYLENTGGLNFKPSTFPASIDGRWLTFDVGDIDGDGDLDIVLGAANRAPYQVPKSIAKRWETGPAVMILRNTTRTRK